MKQMRMTHTILAIAIALCLVLSLTSCNTEKKEAEAAFSEAVISLDSKNVEYDEAIDALAALLTSEAKPLDESLLSTCQQTITDARAARVSAPEMASSTEEILTQVTEIESVDYADNIEQINEARESLEYSIKQNEQITNPSSEFVLQRLATIEHVQSPAAVTEDADPNGLLNKQGGYTAAVYFVSDLVDQSMVYNDGLFGIEALDKGTDGGGCIEVFATEREAQGRDDYLTMYDAFGPGSHHVYGTCIVRTSRLLSASEQTSFELAIVETLTRVE